MELLYDLFGISTTCHDDVAALFADLSAILLTVVLFLLVAYIADLLHIYHNHLQFGGPARTRAERYARLSYTQLSE